MDLLYIINSLICFILALYGDCNLPRNIVQNVIEYFTNFTRQILLPSLKKDLMDILKEHNLPNQVLRQIDNCFSNHSSIFDHVSNETKRLNILRTKGFVDFKEYIIGHFLENCTVENELRYVLERMYATHVPLKRTLKFS